MEVYLDVLVLENLLMNYLILAVTSRFLKQKRKPWRLLLGSAIGVIYALLFLFFPFLQTSSAIVVLCKFLLSLLMIAATFYPRRIRDFLGALGCFYAVTFLMAGTAFAVILMGVPIGSIQNGAFYLNWDSPINYLLLVIGCGWILLHTLYSYLKEKQRLDKCLVSLYLEFDGNGLWVPALVDTGNELKDPFTGIPVIIVETEAISSLLPGCLQQTVSGGDTSRLLEREDLLAQSGWATRFRLVPYRSLGCPDGMLPGFKPDVLAIRGKGEERWEPSNVIVCLYSQSLSDNHTYRALLAPELLPA